MTLTQDQIQKARAAAGIPVGGMKATVPASSQRISQPSVPLLTTKSTTTPDFSKLQMVPSLKMPGTTKTPTEGTTLDDFQVAVGGQSSAAKVPLLSYRSNRPAKQGGSTLDDFRSAMGETQPQLPGGGVVRKGLSYIADKVVTGAKQIYKDITDQGERYANTPDDALGTLVEKPAILGQGLGKVTKDAIITLYSPIGDAINLVADKISDLKPVQQIAATEAAGKILNAVGNLSMSIEDLKKKHPDLAEAADELIVIGGQALGSGPEAGAAKGASKGVSDALEGAAKGFKGGPPPPPGGGVGSSKAFSAGLVVGKTARQTAETASRAKETLTTAPSPFKASFEAQTAREFAEEGITAPVSAITSSPFLKALEAMSAKGIFGKGVMETVNKAREAVDTKIARTAEEATPKKTMSDETLGKTMATDLRNSVTTFKDAQDKVYTQFAKHYGAVEEAPYNTIDVLRQIIADQGEDFFRGVDTRMQKMFDRLTGETKDVKKMRADGVPEKVIESEKANNAPTMTVDEMRSTRTSIGEALIREPDNGALKRLYGALSADLKAALGVHDEAGAVAMQKLDADYASGISRLEGRIAQSIEQANPETIVHKLFARDSADAIGVLQKLVKPETFDEYRRFFLRDLFERSVVRGKFSVEKLKQNIAEYDDATLEAALNADSRAMLDSTIARLEKLEKLSEALKPGEKILGGSQTAFLQQATAPGTAIGAMGTALLTGQFGVAALIAGGLAGKYGVSKLFTTEAGRRMLTGGKDLIK